MPVVACDLHSQVGCVAAAFAAAAAGADRRLVYVMTDSAALPLAFSDLVADLIADGRLAASVSCGQAFGGDFEAVNVVVDGEPVRLTRREFELLRYLVGNRNRVVSRDRLLERVWGYEQFIETRSVDVHVGRLRSKLGAAGNQIETVVGLGYRFVE